MLCEPGWLGCFEEFGSHRRAALATDHYLVSWSVGIEIPPVATKQMPGYDKTALTQKDVRDAFTDVFNSCAGAADTVQRTLDNMKHAIAEAEQVLPHRGRKTQQPWVTQKTLDLIRQRSLARSSQNAMAEKSLLKQVRKSVKQYKTAWMDSLKRVCRPKPRRQGRIKILDGELVESTERADTIAEYFEKVQWQVRPATLLPREPLGPPLPISDANGDFKAKEGESTWT